MASRVAPCLAAIATLTLGACAMGPEYQRPEMPIPAQWPLSALAGEPVAIVGAGNTAFDPSAAVSSSGWRMFFPDPRLQSLIADALEHNRDLRVALGRVEEARALSGVARSERFPELGLTVQGSSALTPGDLNSAGRPSITRRFDASLGVASFELDFWGRVRNLDDAARASFLASSYAERAFRLSLIADVAQAWFLLLELDERLALAQASGASRESTRTLVSRRRDVGLVSDIDALQADGALHNARIEIANLARQRAAAENALRLLVGSTRDLSGDGLPRLAAVRAVGDMAAGVSAEVLLSRPDVLAAEQRLIAANANIGAARAAFLPKIVLSAATGSASSALSGLFDAGSGAWSFVPVLRLPLFDGGRRSASLDVAEARKTIAVADYEKVIQQAFRDVATLLAARSHIVAQLQAQLANAQVQSERLRLIEARHAAGVSSHLELLDAQRDSFTAQQALVTVRQLSQSTAAGLYKALGGP